MSKTYTLRLSCGEYLLTQEVPQACRFLFRVSNLPSPFGEGGSYIGQYSASCRLEGNLCFNQGIDSQVCRHSLLISELHDPEAGTVVNFFWNQLFEFVRNFVTNGDAFQLEIHCEGEKSERLGENFAERFTRLDRDFGYDHSDERGL